MVVSHGASASVVEVLDVDVELGWLVDVEIDACVVEVVAAEVEVVSEVSVVVVVASPVDVVTPPGTVETVGSSGGAGDSEVEGVVVVATMIGESESWETVASAATSTSKPTHETAATRAPQSMMR